MSISIPFVATADTYSDACTIQAQNGKTISFTVANNSAVFQLGFLDPAGEIHWGEEIPTNPSEGGFSGVAGIRFRSYTPGKPAVVVATLYLEIDPQPQGSTAYTSSLSSSGGQTPGVSSVQIDNNGALVGTEPILNFEDLNGTFWSIGDDGSKINIQPNIIIGSVKNDGNILAGHGFTVSFTEPGIYVITLENPLPVPSVVCVTSSNGQNGNENFAVTPFLSRTDTQFTIYSFVGAVATSLPFDFIAIGG